MESRLGVHERLAGTARVNAQVINFYLEPDAEETESAEEDDSILRAALAVRRKRTQVDRVVRELQGT